MALVCAATVAFAAGGVVGGSLLIPPPVIATRSRPASFMVGVSVAARSLSAATAGVALDINYSTISIMTQLPDADSQTMAASVGTGFSWDTCPTSCR